MIKCYEYISGSHKIHLRAAGWELLVHILWISQFVWGWHKNRRSLVEDDRLFPNPNKFTICTRKLPDSKQRMAQQSDNNSIDWENKEWETEQKCCWQPDTTSRLLHASYFLQVPCCWESSPQLHGTNKTHSMSESTGTESSTLITFKSWKITLSNA